MRNFLLIGFALSVSACMQGVQSHSGTALEAKFSGKTMAMSADGAPNTVMVTFNPDGTGFGIFNGVKDDMEWRVENTAICVDDPGQLGDPEDCAQVFWTGPDSIRLVRTSRSGKVMELTGRFVN